MLPLSLYYPRRSEINASGKAVEIKTSKQCQLFFSPVTNSNWVAV